MFVRPCYRKKDGKRHAYWALVESYRTERGPRQRIVSYLGRLDEQGRIAVEKAAAPNCSREENNEQQLSLPFANDSAHEEPSNDEPRWVTVNASAVRVEHCVRFGGPWLALELIKKIDLHDFLRETIPRDGADVAWSSMALILVICRLCEPSSELHIAEHFYRETSLAQLLGVPVRKVYHTRLYRALDQLLPHKEKLELFLKDRLGKLFELEYDLLLYDVTSEHWRSLKGRPRGFCACWPRNSEKIPPENLTG